jgi:hypothetical protein
MNVRFVIAALVAAAATITTASCLMCNEIACIGGLEWEARPFDRGTMKPGIYSLALELDSGSYHFDCTVSPSANGSACSGPADGDDDEFEVSVDLVSDRQGPVSAIVVDASALEGDEQRSTRGPRDVHVVLEREGVTLIDARYDIAYQRDDDFFGDERCGACDLQQKRSTTWADE